jgi:multiple sugar transport system permease protein
MPHTDTAIPSGAPAVGNQHRRRIHMRTVFVASMLSPAVIALAALTIFPFLSNLYNSLHEYSLTSPNSKDFILLGNYTKILFQDADFWHALTVSAYFTVGAVALEILLGLVIASLLNREFAGRGLLLTIFIVPMAATPIAITFVWRMMFSPSLGILNYLVKLIGLPASNWVADSNIVIPCLILVDAWQWTPFVILVLLAGLMSLPPEPMEAAAMDGANRWQVFRHITLPLLEPFIMLAVLFRTIDAFKAFDLIFVMTTGGPGNASESLNILTFRQGFQFLNMGYAAALSIIMLVIIIVISQLLLKRSRLAVA